MRFPLAEGFPLLTTKKLNTKAIVHELLWFLRGETNVRPLQEVGVHIWDEWADENGELGPVYGKQWRSWPAPDGSSIDQITQVMERLKGAVVAAAHRLRLECRRHRPHGPCPLSLPVPVLRGRDQLSCQLYQRSADVFLGVPFNIASYSLLTHMVAQACGLKAHEFVHVLGDTHIYRNHVPQVAVQLAREPRGLPRLPEPLREGDLRLHVRGRCHRRLSTPPALPRRHRRLDGRRRMPFSLIAAIAAHRVIGDRGQAPLAPAGRHCPVQAPHDGSCRPHGPRDIRLPGKAAGRAGATSCSPVTRVFRCPAARSAHSVAKPWRRRGTRRSSSSAAPPIYGFFCPWHSACISP